MANELVAFTLHGAGYALLVATYLWMYVCLRNGKHAPARAYALMAVAYALLLTAFVLDHRHELTELAHLLPMPTKLAQLPWPEAMIAP